MTEVLLLALIAITVHRVWIYEDIFKPVRKKITRKKWLKFLYCPPCFAFWACVVSTAFIPLFNYDWGIYVIAPFSSYGVLRLVVAVTRYLHDTRDDRVVKVLEHLTNSGLLQNRPVSQEATQSAPSPVKDIKATIVTLANANCEDCERNAALSTMPAHGKERKRLLHLTAFAAFDPSYSLCNVVVDQTRAALRQGMFVCVAVVQGFDLNTIPDDLLADENFMLKALIPPLPAGAKEDKIYKEQEKDIEHAMRTMMMSMGRGVCFTHDLLFVSHFLTHAKCLHNIGDLSAWDIYNVCHSAPGPRLSPSMRLNVPEMEWRYTLPEGQKLISLNFTDKKKLAGYYKTETDNVSILQNPKDVESFLGLDSEACRIAHEAGLLEVDVAMVMPVSLPRAESKGIYAIIETLSHMKKYGRSVRLLVVDAHASSEEAIKVRTGIDAWAIGSDLAKEVIFVSDIVGKDRMHHGLEQHQIAALMLHANVFMAASISESSPLTVMEAALAGNLIVVNSDVPALFDIVDPLHSLSVSFGIFNVSPSSADHFNTDQIAAVSDAILARLAHNTALASKRSVMARFNLNEVGKRIKGLAK